MNQQQFGEDSKFNGRIVLGLLILLFGILMLLNNVDIIDVGPVWKLWPLILIFVGINTFISGREDGYSGMGVWDRKQRRPHIGGGIWLIFLGLWFLVSVNHFWGLHFRDTWPVLIIGWGIILIWKSLRLSSGPRIAEENHGT